MCSFAKVRLCTLEVAEAVEEAEGGVAEAEEVAVFQEVAEAGVCPVHPAAEAVIHGLRVAGVTIHVRPAVATSLAHRAAVDLPLVPREAVLLVRLDRAEAHRVHHNFLPVEVEAEDVCRRSPRKDPLGEIVLP